MSAQLTFRLLLGATTCATSVFLWVELAPRLYLLLLLAVQLVTLFNSVFIRSRSLQVWMHDLFVGMLIYAVLSDAWPLRLYGDVVAIATLVARAKFDRCPFLWWHESRNTVFDALGELALVIAHILPPPAHRYNIAVAVAFGGASHFLQRTDVATRTHVQVEKEIEKCV